MITTKWLVALLTAGKQYTYTESFDDIEFSKRINLIQTFKELNMLRNWLKLQMNSNEIHL